MAQFFAALSSRIIRASKVTFYYLSWIVFGVVGLVLNILCVPLLILPRRQAYETPVRVTIRRLFQGWLAWLNACRVVSIEWKGFEGEPLQPGTVYIANHPTIVDATIILALLPDAVCIFKPSLMRNPAIGPAALMAGYVRGDTGIEVIKAAAEKVAAGQSLLIFPEGTRTAPGTTLGRMKPGFALIADRARAPVRLVVIRSTPELGEKGRPWWPAPQILPARFSVSLDRSWPYEPGRSAAQLTEAVERRVYDVLASPFT